MAKKCGCGSTRCFCAFEDSPSVQVAGSGTAEDPYTPNVVPPLSVQDTESLDLRLDQTANGLTLTAFPTRPISVQKFTADGEWEAPPGVVAVRIMLVAGGGGGGAGHGSERTERSWGGTGGASGAVTNLTLAGSEIPASATITIGQGGAGGAAAALGADGGDGAPGGDTAFGAFRALGGGGGLGGRDVEESDVIIGGQASPVGGTVPGASALAANVANFVVVERLAPGPGGKGGGHVNGAAYSPRAGGFSLPGIGNRPIGPLVFPSSNDESGTMPPGSNLDGIDNLVNLMGSGGAGASSLDVRGGHGGLYGGGGGGGRGNLGVPGTPGGDGADGVCVVIAW